MSLERQVQLAPGAGPLAPTSWVEFINNGNSYITTPDATELDIGGSPYADIDVRVMVTVADWTPGAAQTFVGKWEPTGNQRSWKFGLNASNELEFMWSHNGALTPSAQCQVPVGWADGDTVRLRATLKVYNEITPGYTCTFWTSTNGHVWVPIGVEATTTGGATEIKNGTAPLMIGGYGTPGSTSERFTGGAIYSLEVRAGIDGPVVASLDPDEMWDVTDTSWTSLAGNPWTRGSQATAYTRWEDVDPMGNVRVSSGRSTTLDRFPPGTFNLTLESSEREWDPDHAAGTHFGLLKSRMPGRVRGRDGGAPLPVARGTLSSGFPQRYNGQTSYVPLSFVDGFAHLAGASTADSLWEIAAAIRATTVPPVAWWRFRTTDEIEDVSGNGNTLSVVGAPPAVDPIMPGATASVLRFDPPDRATRPQDMIPDYPFAVEAWIRTDAVDAVATPTASATVLDMREPGDDVARVGMYLTPTGLQLVLSDGTTANMSSQIAKGGPTFPSGYAPMPCMDGHLHHVLWQVYGPLSFDIELDGDGGSSLTTVAVAGTVPSTMTATTMTIGSRPPDSDVQVPIEISEMTLWDDGIDPAFPAWRSTEGRQTGELETVDQRIRQVLESAGWPVELTDLDATPTRLQPYAAGSKALDLLQVLEQTEDGQLFIDPRGRVRLRNRRANITDPRSTTVQLTLTEADYLADGFGIEADDVQVRNEIEVSRVDGATAPAVDAASREIHGPQPLSVTGLLLRTDAESRRRARRLLNRYKDQTQRVDTIRIDLADQPTLATDVLDARIGDRQAVERTPQGVGSEVTLTALVEGFEHDIGPVMWTVTEHLSTQLVRDGLFIIGSSLIGGADVLA